MSVVVRPIATRAHVLSCRVAESATRGRPTSLVTVGSATLRWAYHTTQVATAAGTSTRWRCYHPPRIGCNTRAAIGIATEGWGRAVAAVARTWKDSMMSYSNGWYKAVIWNRTLNLNISKTELMDNVVLLINYVWLHKNNLRQHLPGLWDGVNAPGAVPFWRICGDWTPIPEITGRWEMV